MRNLMRVIPWLCFVLAMIGCSVAYASCFQSDVKALCCPAACAVKSSSHWYQAPAVLRGCMAGLGCDGKGASVFLVCGC